MAYTRDFSSIIARLLLFAVRRRGGAARVRFECVLMKVGGGGVDGGSCAVSSSSCLAGNVRLTLFAFSVVLYCFSFFSISLTPWVSLGPLLRREKLGFGSAFSCMYLVLIPEPPPHFLLFNLVSISHRWKRGEIGLRISHWSLRGAMESGWNVMVAVVASLSLSLFMSFFSPLRSLFQFRIA